MPMADFLKIISCILVFGNAHGISSGISTNTFKPNSKSSCEMPNGWRLTRGNNMYEVVPEGRVVHVECPEGFNTLGTNKITCLRGGMWNTNFPSCELSRTNAQEQWRKFALPIRFGTSIRVVSSMTTEGKRLINDIHTATATWLPGTETTSINSSPPGDSCKAGSVRTFACPYPFQLDGQFIQECQPNGKWVMEEPNCNLVSSGTGADEHVTIAAIKLTLPKRPVTSSTVLTSTTTQPSEHAVTLLPTSGMTQSSSSESDNCEPGGFITYTCPHPFEVDGESLQVCPPSGKWDTKEPKCKRICGKRDPKIPEIINGRPARKNEIPWQVALSKKESFLIFCGGVLISERFVLTAAHCITEERSTKLLDANAILLFFGKLYTEQNDDTKISRKVSNLYLNPDYDSINFESDLGLIQLEEVVEVNYIVMPLCLPQTDSTITYEEGQKGLVAGWGFSNNNGSRPPTLHMIELPIVSSDKCKSSYATQEFKRTVTENMFCAGLEEGGKSTCLGDSGGAMSFYSNGKYVLEGIVSWGNTDDCAAPGFYAGFVRVKNFLNWIKGFI